MASTSECKQRKWQILHISEEGSVEKVLKEYLGLWEGNKMMVKIRVRCFVIYTGNQEERVAAHMAKVGHTYNILVSKPQGKRGLKYGWEVNN